MITTLTTGSQDYYSVNNGVKMTIASKTWNQDNYNINPFTAAI